MIVHLAGNREFEIGFKSGAMKNKFDVMSRIDDLYRSHATNSTKLCDCA